MRYKTPWISKYLLEQGVTPAAPYTRPRSQKEGFQKKTTCMMNILTSIYVLLTWYYLTRLPIKKGTENTNLQKICKSCRYLSMCTESKNHQKVVTRHVWQNHLEEVEHLRQHQHVKQIYAKRKETVERVFADAKEKHGMRWTTLRGLKKLSMQAMLTFVLP